MDNFISPHVHPMSLDSASTPEAFAEREKELQTGALVCTDHGSLAAAYKIYDLAKKNNLTPILGLEGYMRQDDCPILEKLGIAKTDKMPKGIDKVKWAQEHPNGLSYYEYNKYYHITLGFKDFKAYKAAVKLLSKADARAEQHGSERKPLFDWSDLEELASYNTTAMSGCLVGMVARHLLTDMDGVSQETKVAAAKAYFERLHYLFKDRFYVEVFPHECTHEWQSGVFIEVENKGAKETIRLSLKKKVKTNAGEFKATELIEDKSKHTELLGVYNYRVYTPYEAPMRILGIEKKEQFIQNECTPWSPNGDMQHGANVFMMGMAKRHKIPCLASDDSHLAYSRHKLVQDVRLSQMGEWRFFGSYHRKASDEAYEHFKKHHNTTEKEFESWIENSKQWAEGFKGFVFESKPQLPTKFYPQDTLGHIKMLINKYGRMPKNNPVYIERLKKELDLFHKNGTIDLLPYFSMASEVCRLYQNQGELTGPGRGSACGCLLSYLIGVTHLDPIKNDLSLERFMTKSRLTGGKGMADVDLDFCHRDLLIGKECHVIEVEASDGTKHVLPEGFKIDTSGGVMSVEEALSSGVEFEPWWSK